MLDVVTAHENAAPKFGSGVGAIQPRHGVLVLGIRVFRQFEEGLEVGETLTIAANPHTRNSTQLQPRCAYQSRQPESADRGAKPFRVAIAGAAQHLSVRAPQLEFDHVMPEAADSMMILAVHIIGDRTAHRYQRGTGSNRRKPAVRQSKPDDLAQQYAGFAFEHARDRIEADETIQATGQQQRAPAVQADVTVTAPIAERQHGLGIRQSVKAVGQCDQTLLVTRPSAPG